MKQTQLSVEQRIDRYLAIRAWTRRRYTDNGIVVTRFGGRPTAYTRIERLAFERYIHPLRS